VTAPNAASTPGLSIRPRALARRSTIPLGQGADARLQPTPAKALVDLETAAYAPIPPRIATHRGPRRLLAPD
jgi:hypothetical protein